jgi:hypothetical protein
VGTVDALSEFLRLFAKLLTGRRLSPEERRRLEEGAAALEEEEQCPRGDLPARGGGVS